MAGRKIGEIYGEIKLKNQQFNTGLAQSQSKLKAFKRSASVAFKAMAVAAAAAAAIVIKMTKDTVRYSNEMRKASLATGVAVEQFQELAYAAKQEHADVSALEKGLGNLTIRLGYAGDGLETYLRYFRALGLEYRNQDGTLRKTEDVFADIADKAHKGALSTEELAAITQLFGARAGRVLIPMLKKGSEWFKTMADEARTLGIVMTEENIEAVKTFDDGMTRLKESFNAVKRTIIIELLPSLQEFVRWTAELIPVAIGALIASFQSMEHIMLRIRKGWLLLRIVSGQHSEELVQGLVAINQSLLDNEALQVRTIKKWAEMAAKVGQLNLDLKETVEEFEELNEEVFIFSQVKLGPYLYEMDVAKGKTIDVKDATGVLIDKLYGMRSAIGSAFKEGANVANIFLNVLIDVVAQLIIASVAARSLAKATGAAGAAGAGEGPGFWGTVLSAAATVLPFFLQKGGYVPGQLLPQVSSGRVTQPSFLVGEGREGETVVPDSKWKDMITVNVHNANPHTYVETLINLPKSEWQRLYRRGIKEAADREDRR